MKFAKSISEEGKGVSCLILILGKGSYGKYFVLDAAITTLKNKFGYTDENYLFMVPTGKQYLMYVNQHCILIKKD